MSTLNNISFYEKQEYLGMKYVVFTKVVNGVTLCFPLLISKYLDIKDIQIKDCIISSAGIVRLKENGSIEISHEIVDGISPNIYRDYWLILNTIQNSGLIDFYK